MLPADFLQGKHLKALMCQKVKRQTKRNIFPTSALVGCDIKDERGVSKTSRRTRLGQGQLHSHTNSSFFTFYGHGEKPPLRTGKGCLILEETGAWDATWHTHQHVTYADTQYDTHIVAFAVFHLCCHTGSTIFWGIGHGQSSIDRKNVLCNEWILQKATAHTRLKKRKRSNNSDS